MKPPAGIRTALARGWRKRCPHCGRGPLYTGWLKAIDRCSYCGLVFARDHGATWFFIIMGDRAILLPLIGLIYFGVLRSHPILAVLLFFLVAAAFVWTTPNRMGACTALHYLSRAAFGDEDDPIPRHHAGDPGGADSRHGVDSRA